MSSQVDRIARRAVGAMFFLLGAGYASWVSRIPAMRDRLGLGDRDLGLLLLATAVGAIAAFRSAARLTARYGSRRVTQVSSALMCVSVALPGFAPTPLWAAFALAAVGMSTGIMDVAMNAHGVEVERRIGRPILGSLHGLFSLGGLVGAGAGALAASQGLSSITHLVAAGIVFEVFALFFGRTLLPHELSRESPHEEPSSDAPPAHSFTRPNGILIALGAVAFCSSVGEGAMADWSAVYLRDILHTSEAVAPLGFAAFSLAMLLGRFSGDRLTLRFGSVGIVRYGGLLVAAGLAFGLITNTVPTTILGFLCVGLGLSVVMPTAFRASGRVPGVAPSAGLATMATLGYGGFLLGPPAIGFVSEHFTVRGGLAVVVVLAIVLTALAPSVEGRPLRPGAAFDWLTSRVTRS
ncbi:MFS transporter [Pendulispora albinea]|uniref:MFS transporter n=1 Tax=Pendulispora albinea TaxID=2741071 RepID=A0ABZ2M0B9_9BACT